MTGIRSKASTTLGFRSRGSNVTGRDLLEVAKLVVLCLLAWITPPRWWRRIATIASPPGLTSTDQLIYKRVLGSDFDADAVANLDRRRRVCNREARIQILGLSGPWRSWRPEIRFCGEAHLKEALAQGNGAILWVAETPYSLLMVHFALNHAGYRANQLIRPTHGFYHSQFGIRFLNPLWRRVEARFVEHVCIQENDTKTALETLRKCLAKNGVVTISINSEARKLVEVRFLHYRIHLPSGPLSLARKTGAAIIPVFPIASASGSFEVIIDHPLPIVKEEESFDHALSVYAKRLEPFVKAYPEQWT